MRHIFMAAVLSAATFPAFAATGYTLTVISDWSYVNDINNLGVGVGKAGKCCNFFAQTYSSTGTSPLSLPSSIVTSEAFGINDHGTIVGSAGPSTWERRAFVYANGTYRDLSGLAGGSSTAYAVNNAGSVLVTYQRPNEVSYGSYVWSEAGGKVDLGSLGGGYTSAHALNERGQVAGVSATTDGHSRAFRWTDGKMEDLGSFQGEFGFSVYGISEQGDVFGSTDEQLYSHAFVIRANGRTEKYSDLSRIAYMDAKGRIYGMDQNGLGVIVDNGVKTSIASLTEGAADWQISPEAVNEAGQILASTYDGKKVQIALLSPVPEPATYAMLGLGLGLLCLARRTHPAKGTARP